MSQDPITVYTSRTCPHSWAVEQFLKRHDIAAHFINVDGDPDARGDLKQLNNGYASVPTLVFADGTHLTEPSFPVLRRKLGMTDSGIVARIRRFFSGRSNSS